MTDTRAEVTPASHDDGEPSALGADPPVRRSRRLDATGVLTVYLILLCALPSGLTVTALGSVGHPADLWALGTGIWWAAGHLQRSEPESTRSQPLRVAYLLFACAALISFAWAMIRGIPSSEVLTVTTGLVTVASWGGVLLVANDLISSVDRLRALMHRLVIVSALIAALGLLQFVTKQSLVSWIQLPGMTLNSPDISGLAARSGYVRASGTSAHPLEFAIIVCVGLALAIVMAFTDTKRSIWHRWLPVVLLAAAAATSVSRSTLIGAVVAVIVSLPALPAKARFALVGVGSVFVVGIGIVVPGMLGTIVSLFSGLSSDPSAVSRTNGISLIVDFVSQSPVFGKGFSTFLPSYYIFDDAYLLMTTEMGIVGVVLFVTLIVTALVLLLRSKRLLFEVEQRRMAQGMFAAVLACGILFAFFDGLSFPQAAGILFLLIGSSGALWRLARTGA